MNLLHLLSFCVVGYAVYSLHQRWKTLNQKKLTTPIPLGLYGSRILGVTLFVAGTIEVNAMFDAFPELTKLIYRLSTLYQGLVLFGLIAGITLIIVAFERLIDQLPDRQQSGKGSGG